MPFNSCPSWRLFNNFSRSSLFSDSSTLRRDTTTLLRFWSSLMTLKSSTCPSSCSLSLSGLTSTSEPGKKARISLISTVNPPLTRPLINPLIGSPSLNTLSRISHDSLRRAFSRDNRVSPNPSSTVSIATLTVEPTSISNSPLSFKNCVRGMTPSDFRPA